jgi:LysR family glycine cleavage system transcriptional activator
MRRKIPSTASLAAFESAARHQSFTRAAAELSLTQSAVCRQVATLEAFLGVKLFRRSRRGVVLTEAGERYGRQIRTRLDEVERDTLDLMARGGAGGALELAVVPTFATRWLLPRMAGFRLVAPDLTVHLSSRTRPFLFDDTAFDAAVYAGPAGWPGTESRFLMRESLIVVGKPSLAARGPLAPGKIAKLPLLQQSTRPTMWHQWFEALGLQVTHDMAGPRMELFSMLCEAAADGLGIALVPPFLVEHDLAQGRLARLDDRDFRSDRSYYLIYPESKAESPGLSVFRDWLDEEAQSYRAANGLG